MPVHRRPLAVASLLSLVVVTPLACSSSGGAADPGTQAGSGGTVASNNGGQPNGASGSSALGDTGGQAMSGGGSSSAGTTSIAGTNASGTAGAGNSAGAGGSAGVDPGDTPAWRPLNVTAPAGTKPLSHTVNGNSVGLDTRAKPLGKLVIDLGVTSGGYQQWLGKRGFHVMGVSFPMCGSINNWDLGRDYDGDCRLNTFDGAAHGTQSAVAKADSIATKIATGLKQLQTQYAEEDWGYFLNQDDTVRWSDVAFTGRSHGASTAAVIGTAVRLYRVVTLRATR